MKMRKLVFLLAFVPVLVWAQAPPDSPSPSEKGPGDEGLNAPTRAVLLANCPKDMAAADWLRMMEKPVNRSLYPIRLTQGMLDTLDASKLDLQYQYVLVPNEAVPSGSHAR
ncbi:MAG: hypothetical protein KF843_15300 [Flavobacteriales bacterium]|nr:hypothetical protein [Flavobacteriales bacterium]